GLRWLPPKSKTNRPAAPACRARTQSRNVSGMMLDARSTYSASLSQRSAINSSAAFVSGEVVNLSACRHSAAYCRYSTAVVMLPPNYVLRHSSGTADLFRTVDDTSGRNFGQCQNGHCDSRAHYARSGDP